MDVAAVDGCRPGLRPTVERSSHFARRQAPLQYVSQLVAGNGLEETKEAVNHWSVSHSMSDTILEDLSLPVEFEMNQDERTAHVSIPGYLEATGEPLRNPFNGASRRVQIRCPDGIEFDIADIGNGPVHTQ